MISRKTSAGRKYLPRMETACILRQIAKSRIKGSGYPSILLEDVLRFTCRSAVSIPKLFSPVCVSNTFSNFRLEDGILTESG